VVAAAILDEIKQQLSNAHPYKEWLERTQIVLEDLKHSYVDLEDPTYLDWDYAKAVASVIDTAYPEGEPLRAYHIGGGGLTSRAGLWTGCATGRRASASSRRQLGRLSRTSQSISRYSAAPAW
jgi:HAMP domain-containing protein